MVLGFGIGWVISPSIVALQNVVASNQQGMAMGVMSLFRQMGATIGTTAMGVFVGAAGAQTAATLAPAIHSGFVALTLGGVLMLAMAVATQGMPLRGRVLAAVPAEVAVSAAQLIRPGAARRRDRRPSPPPIRGWRAWCRTGPENGA